MSHFRGDPCHAEAGPRIQVMLAGTSLGTWVTLARAGPRTQVTLAEAGPGTQILPQAPCVAE